MCEAVKERACEAFRSEDLGPFVEEPVASSRNWNPLLWSYLRRRKEDQLERWRQGSVAIGQVLVLKDTAHWVGNV